MLLPATTLRLVPKLPVFDYLFFPLPTNGCGDGKVLGRDLGVGTRLDREGDGHLGRLKPHSVIKVA